MGTRATARAGLVLWAMVAAGACSNELDETANCLPYEGVQSCLVDDADTAAPPDISGDVVPGECGCATVGTWYRFTSLGLSSIDGGTHPVMGTLNPLWADDIEKNELNIVFEVVRVEADEVELRAYSGARMVGTDDVCILTGTDVPVIHPRDGCTFAASALTGLNVYAGTPVNPKNCSTTLTPNHAIQARQARLSATLSDTCDVLEGVVVEAVLGEDELKATCTCLVLGDTPADDCGALDPSYGTAPDAPADAKACPGCNDIYVNLESLMQAFGEVKFTGQLEDGRRGAVITGFFEAHLIDASPPVCP